MTLIEHRAEDLLVRFCRFAHHPRPIPRVAWRVLQDLIDQARRAVTVDRHFCAVEQVSALELELLAAAQHCRVRS